jgi:putative redox protein
MRVELSYKGDEEFDVVNSHGNVLHIDTRTSAEKQHQGPVELVASALIACAAVDIVSMVKKRRKTFVDLKGVATYERMETVPRFITKVNLHYIITSPDLTDAEAERIVTLAATKYCSVAGSLKAEQTHSFEIVRP